MGCKLCGKTETAADVYKDYVCGSCVTKVMGLDPAGRQLLVDQLYLHNNIEGAEFLEIVFFGKRLIRQELKLKRRIL